MYGWLQRHLRFAPNDPRILHEVKAAAESSRSEGKVLRACSGLSWRTPPDRIYIPTPGRQRSGAITQREITVERTFSFLFARNIIVTNTVSLEISLQAFAEAEVINQAQTGDK